MRKEEPARPLCTPPWSCAARPARCRRSASSRFADNELCRRGMGGVSTVSACPEGDCPDERELIILPGSEAKRELMGVVLLWPPSCTSFIERMRLVSPMLVDSSTCLRARERSWITSAMRAADTSEVCVCAMSRMWSLIHEAPELPTAREAAAETGSSTGDWLVTWLLADANDDSRSPTLRSSADAPRVREAVTPATPPPSPPVVRARRSICSSAPKCLSASSAPAGSLCAAPSLRSRSSQSAASACSSSISKAPDAASRSRSCRALTQVSASPASACARMRSSSESMASRIAAVYASCAAPPKLVSASNSASKSSARGLSAAHASASFLSPSTASLARR
mmetsp:Transcript_16720/g.42715  ORF Transcript_16720/g.42715 Transcript_16720/m.42715 type:complete len:340 (+) Transcript_16720:318-1337(+)